MEIGQANTLACLALRSDFGVETWLRSRVDFQTRLFGHQTHNRIFQFQKHIVCDEIFGFIIIIMSNVPLFWFPAARGKTG